MTSRERIINAAIEVFAKKGRHGARMEEIAATAKINKAMIYYIFHNKDELYLETLKAILKDLIIQVSETISKDSMEKDSPIDLLITDIERNFLGFNSNMNYTKILVDAVSNGAEEIPKAIKYCKEELGEEVFRSGTMIIQKGITSGMFRNIDIEQLHLSIHGMIMIFYMTRSMCNIFDIHVGDESEFIKKRKESIIDLILHGILKKE
jgi:TetR/AcrR family transcriptional regulator